MRLRGKRTSREDIERQTDLVVLEPGKYKGRWNDFFGNDQPIHVELGMGKGKFISEMSALHPEINFIGIDMYDGLIHKATEKARRVWQEKAETAPPNLALVVFNIERIEDVFATDEVERVYLNFSDPWPKNRHARRRLTHPGFVRKYMDFLNENGEIHFKTDSRTLFEFSLNSFADMGLRMRNISLDLHRDGPAPNNVMTEYEKKFSSNGMNIHRVEVVIGQAVLQDHLAQVMDRYSEKPKREEDETDEQDDA
jgi:tRNA (guanine-N7-)-methyltransferase